jgi:hypothetical protein
MPLCQVSRIDKKTCRHFPCIVENKVSGNRFIGCRKIPHRMHFILPDDLKNFIPTRSQLQQREQHNREKHREVARTKLTEAVEYQGEQ